MKKTIKITAVILSIGIITAWIFNLIDNEKTLWAFTVLLPTVIAFLKENKITEMKKDIEVLNKQNQTFIKENLRLNKKM